MLLRLLLLFTIVPIVELMILIPLGNAIGLWPTIGLIVATGVFGAVLGKRQGAAAWRRLQDDLRQGKVPGDSLLDGLAVLIAGAFLVTPGVLTDVAGVVLLLPVLRRPLKRYLKKRFRRSIDQGTVSFIQFDGPFSDGSPLGGGGPFGAQPTPDEGDVIDVTPDEPSEEDDERQRLDR